MAKATGSTSRLKKKPAPVSEERETIINLKGSKRYAAWLDEVHRSTHIPKVQLFRLAIAEWAQGHGHPVPPEI
jgi:hypothetical protein